MTLEGNLASAVEAAFRDTAILAAIRAEGEPRVSGYFPDPPLSQLHQELVWITSRHWDSRWIPSERYLHWNVRKLLWDASLSPIPTRPEIEKAVADFIARAAAKVAKYVVIVPIRGAHGLREKAAVANAEIGDLASLLGEAIEGQVRSKLGRLDPLWAKVDVEAPNEELAIEVSRERVDEAIDFLASTDPRMRFDRGEPSRMEVGDDFGFVGPAGINFWISREWLSPREYSLADDVLKDQPSFRAKEGPFPWRKAAPGSEIETILRESYRRFGRARRLARDPEAALPLALSAIEFVLGNRRGDKRHPTAARLMLCAAHLNRAIALPLDVVAWFVARNEIIHEGLSGQPTRWPRNEAMNTLLEIYDFLDLAASFAVKSGARTKRELVDKLVVSKVVLDCEKWVDEWLKSLESERKASRSPEFAKALEEDIERWKSIRKFLGTPYDG